MGWDGLGHWDQIGCDLKKKDSIYLLLESGEGREKEREEVFASHTPPSGNLARNPGMCPDGLQAGLSPLSHTSQSLALTLCQNVFPVCQMLLTLTGPATWAPPPGSLS